MTRDDGLAEIPVQLNELLEHGEISPEAFAECAVTANAALELTRLGGPPAYIGDTGATTVGLSLRFNPVGAFALVRLPVTDVAVRLRGHADANLPPRAARRVPG